MKSRLYWLCVVSIAFAGVVAAKEETVSTADNRGQWVEISAKVLQTLANEEKDWLSRNDGRHCR